MQQGYAPAPPPPPGSGIPQAAAGGKGGSTVVKILLIIVGIIVFFVIVVVAVLGYVGYRVAHTLHEVAHDGKVTIPGEHGGTFSVNANSAPSASELGTDIYPGATATKGGMKMDLPGVKTRMGIFTTSDSKDQVVAFYRDKLGSDSSLMDMGESAMITAKRGEKEQVMVSVSNRANQNEGKTTIAITHTLKE